MINNNQKVKSSNIMDIKWKWVWNIQIAAAPGMADYKAALQW